MHHRKENLSKAVKVIIQGGLVPKEVMQQLIQWGLLPENSNELIGTQLALTNFETERDTAEEFVEELGDALAKESATIRETELDRIGEFQEVGVEFSNQPLKRRERLFVDKLGRVTTPIGRCWEHLTGVTIQGKLRNVVKMELRYKGGQVVAFVHYLDSLEERNGND